MDLVVSLFVSVTNITPSLVTPLMDVACVNQDGLGMSVRCFVQKGSLVQDAQNSVNADGTLLRIVIM